MKTKPARQFTNAYDAYWFIHDHPKLQVEDRVNQDSVGFSTPHNTRKHQDRNGNWYLVFPDMHAAIQTNLDIHYAKVNSERRVDDDESKNVNIECWLEFGPVIWGYGSDFEEGREYQQHCHDINLDCGAPSFDGALIVLAGKVLKHYGDYETK